MKRYTQGFTFIELLVVVSVFLIVGTITAQVLVSSLRNASKTNVLTEARANGNYAVSQMIKLIQNTQDIADPVCSAASCTLTLTDIDGTTNVISCNNHHLEITRTEETKAPVTLSLINSSTQYIDTCEGMFQKIQKNIYEPPSISISFVLVAGTVNGTLPFEKSARVSFHTVAIPRNFQ